LPASIPVQIIYRISYRISSYSFIWGCQTQPHTQQQHVLASRRIEVIIIIKYLNTVTNESSRKLVPGV